MDPYELQKHIAQALSHAEHSIEGAIILGRSAADALTRLQILYQELFLGPKAAGLHAKAHLQGSGNEQHSGTYVQPETVTEGKALNGDHDEVVAAVHQQADQHAANSIQKNVKAERKPVETQQHIIPLQCLRETNASTSGLIEELGSYNSSRSEQEPAKNSVLEGTVRRLAAQIAAKDAEIALLKRQEITSLKPSQPESVATPAPLKCPAAQSLASTEACVQSDRTFALSQCPVLSGEQRKHKQMASYKGEDDRKASESFLRAMQNLKSNSYEKLTKASGHYAPSNQQFNTPASTHGQSRKGSKTKLNPETPPFMPLNNSLNSATSIDRRETVELRKARIIPEPNIEAMDLPSFRPTFDPGLDSTSVENGPSNSSNPHKPCKDNSGRTLPVSGIESISLLATSQAEYKTANTGDIFSETVMTLPQEVETTMTETNQNCVHVSKGNKGFKITSLPGPMKDQRSDGTDYKAMALSERDISFDTFTGQQSTAFVPIPITPPRKSYNIAGSPDSVTQAFDILPDLNESQDLIDLSSKKNSPFRDMTNKMKTAATNSAAFLAAATTAYSSFNTKLYATKEPEDDELKIEEDYVIIEPPIIRPLATSKGSNSLLAPPLINPTIQEQPDPASATTALATISRPISTRTYQHKPPEMNPHNEDAVKKHVIRPNSRGRWVELPLDWKPVKDDEGVQPEGRRYYVL